jgi:hypothetical protein
MIHVKSEHTSSVYRTYNVQLHSFIDDDKKPSSIDKRLYCLAMLMSFDRDAHVQVGNSSRMIFQ